MATFDGAPEMMAQSGCCTHGAACGPGCKLPYVCLPRDPTHADGKPHARRSWGCLAPDCLTCRRRTPASASRRCDAAYCWSRLQGSEG